jgi:hypothetical protein
MSQLQSDNEKSGKRQHRGYEKDPSAPFSGRGLIRLVLKSLPVTQT